MNCATTNAVFVYVEYKRRNELRDYKRGFCLCDAIIQKWYNTIGIVFLYIEIMSMPWRLSSAVVTPSPDISVRENDPS